MTIKDPLLELFLVCVANLSKMKCSDMLSCRRIVSIMVIVGFMMHHMLRINMSIAIVEMITKNSTSLNKNQVYFSWSEEQRNNVLGYFFWGYLISQVPGGRFAEIYGTRIILGTSMLAAGALTISIPFSSTFGYFGVLFNRICLGVVMGVQWPSIYPMASRWIPVNDRSKFMSNLIASSLGAGATLSFCGYLIAYFGWTSVFYVTGSLAVTWAVTWFYLIYDTPAQHPRISVKEKNKLLLELGDQNIKTVSKVIPWIKILTSAPVWAVIVSNVCSGFTFFVILNQLPSYLHQVLEFNIKENGVLSALPYFARYSAALVSCKIADDLIKKQKFSIIFIRQLFTTVSFVGPAILFMLLAFWGYYRTFSIVIFTLSFAFNGSGTAGHMTNTLDIAPNYSGTIYGIANAVGCISGYISTKAVAMITQQNQTFDQWKYIFWILVGANIFGMIFYWCTASGEHQKWSINSTNKEEDKKLKNTLLSNSLS